MCSYDKVSVTSSLRCVKYTIHKQPLSTVIFGLLNSFKWLGRVGSGHGSLISSKTWVGSGQSLCGSGRVQ